jgi:hypothetical protein
MTTTLIPGDVVVTSSGVLYELRNVLPWPGSRTTYVLAPPAPWVGASPLFRDAGRPARSSRRVATPPRFIASAYLRSAAYDLRRAHVRAASLNPNSPAGPLAMARDYLADAVAAGRDTPDMLDAARAELNRLTTLDVSS